VQEVELQVKLAVAEETVEVHSFARKMKNGCCVEPSAGEVECAKPITIPSLLVSAVSLTGSIRKCLVAVVVVMAVEVVVVSLLYKTNAVL